MQLRRKKLGERRQRLGKKGIDGMIWVERGIEG